MATRIQTGVVAALALVVFTVVPANAKSQKAFPRLRSGVGNEPTAGRGVVAGDEFVTRAAVVAWNRKWNSLTLYLFWRRGVTCGTLRRAVQRPGHLIQVHVTGAPRIPLGSPVAGAQVAFLTVFRNPKTPTQVAGLKSGAKLTFTRVDSYPGGVWHGTFTVPRREYANGKVYGYKGTFAAKWCELRH